MPKLGEYYAAALVDIAKSNEGGVIRPRETISELLATYWHIPFSEEDLADAIRILHRCDIAYSEDDEFAGTYIVITEARFRGFLDNVARERQEYDDIVKNAPEEHAGVNRAEDTYLPHLAAYNQFTVLRKYSAFGRDWLIRAMEEIKHRSETGTLDAPAVDRIMPIDGTDPMVVEIRAAAESLEKRLRTGNELGSLTHEQAAVAARELTQIREALSESSVRPVEIAQRARRTLGWVGEKAVGTVIGQAATALFKMIMQFLGIPL